MMTRPTTLALAAALWWSAGASLAQEPAPPLFEYGGKTYGLEELSARMQTLYGRVVSDQHAEMKALVDEMVFDVHVEREARRLGRPAHEVGAEMLAVPEPGDVEVQQFYQRNRDRISQPLENVESQIRSQIKRSAVLQKRAEVLTRLKRDGGFKLRVAAPPMPPLIIDTTGRPVKGDPSAPITVVEFADYQCPNCARAVALMRGLLDKYPGKLKLVHMDFPINPSNISRVVAYGGVCAQAQGRFWEYHDRAYERQDTLHMKSPQELAAAIGMDMTDFEACMNNPHTRSKVQRSEKEGRRLGVNRTPTLFVDGKPFASNDIIRDLGDYVQRKTGAKGSTESGG